jgi:hypothetical protein
MIKLFEKVGLQVHGGMEHNIGKIAQQIKVRQHVIDNTLSMLTHKQFEKNPSTPKTEDIENYNSKNNVW